MASFQLRNFLMKGFRDAVGKLDDSQIILNAAGWYNKEVLTEGDLEEIQTLLDKKNGITD